LSSHPLTEKLFWICIWSAGALILLHAWWGSWFLKQNSDGAKEGATAEVLDQSRQVMFAATLGQICFFVGAFIAANIIGKSVLGYLFTGYIAAMFIHGQINFGIEKVMRKIDVGAWEVLSQGLRGLFSVIGLYATYYAIMWSVSRALGSAENWGLLPQWLGSSIAWISTPVGVICGLVAIYALSPVVIRAMFPAKRVTDPQVIELLTSCFARAGLKAPNFWIINSDRFKVHNAMVAGMKWGVGWFKPSLFFTASLLTKLTKEEFEAIILHEVSHISLNHIRKRLVWSLLGMFVVLLPYILFTVVLAMLLPKEAIASVVLMGVVFAILAQNSFLRTIVRRQEIEADENAVKLGASFEAFASALTKVTLMNDHSVDKKDPNTVFNAAAAHPTTLDRIEILRKRMEAGFPEEPKLAGKLTHRIQQNRGWLVPTAATFLGLIGFFYIAYLKPEVELREAVRVGNIERVRFLIENGAVTKINGKLEFGYFPLYMAARQGHMELVDYFLAAGADIELPNPRNGGMTPLMVAALAGNEKMVAHLIEKGANVKAKARQGERPIHVAAFRGNAKILEILVAKGAGVNERDDHQSTPLTIAAEFGHLSAVQYLLKQGADATARDEEGDSAQSLAASKGHSDIAKLLEEHQAAPKRGLASKK
jgi:ankyrin repeat protein/Zn-dependent protease with chaperone function